MNSGVWEEVGCANLWNEWCRTTDTTHLSPAEAFCVFYHLKSSPSVCGTWMLQRELFRHHSCGVHLNFVFLYICFWADELHL